MAKKQIKPDQQKKEIFDLSAEMDKAIAEPDLHNQIRQTDEFQVLTAKQAAFVLEYCKKYDGKQAAIRAGYSAATAHVIAYDLLQFEKIKTAIALRQELQMRASDITREYVTEQLLAIALADDTRTANKLKAFDLIAKINHLYSDININVTTEIPLFPDISYGKTIDIEILDDGFSEDDSN